jgi:hypothetical protein
MHDAAVTKQAQFVEPWNNLALDGNGICVRFPEEDRRDVCFLPNPGFKVLPAQVYAPIIALRKKCVSVEIPYFN